MSEIDDGWLAPQRGGRGRRRWWRIAGIAVLVVAVVFAAFVGAVAFRATSSLGRIAVPELTAHDHGPRNILVIGSDSRAELDAEQQHEFSTGGETGPERTDTIFVLSIEGGRAALLAFPRDLWVTRCDGVEQRINTAVQAGGPGCLVDTIESLSGIPIHHVVEVSFLGFVDVVNAVEGVEVCLDDPIADRDAGIDLPAGCQRLSGRDALGYVRVRKIDNDLKRIERQQQFVRALAGEITARATLLDPVRLWDLAGSLGAALTVDERMGVSEMLPMARGLRGVAAGELATATVPVTDATRGAAAVLLPTAEADDVFAAFRRGEAFAAGTGDDAPSPEDVEVVVLNGSGRSGAAARARDLLSARGYPVAEIGNADSTAVTSIAHPPGAAAAAQLLAADVERALGLRPDLHEDPTVERVTLVLGGDLPDG